MDTSQLLSLPSIQALYEELGKKLCETHVELICSRNDVEALQTLLACGSNSVSLRAFREQLSMRKQGEMTIRIPDETMVLLVEELEKKCAECSTLAESNEKLRLLMGSGFSEAVQMAAVMVSDLETDETKMLRSRVREREGGMLKVKADYDWEHARRQEYGKELVLMRDMTFLKDLELRTILEMVTGTYMGGNEMSKWSREQLVARLGALEGVCGTMYKDEYIKDRNQRIGLALVNVREESAALNQMEFRVKDLSRLVRRFERLTEHACSEVERFVVDKVQERSEMLRGECELMEVNLAVLAQKRVEMESRCHEVTTDCNEMRRGLQDSRRELCENRAKFQEGTVELKNLVTSIMEKRKVYEDVVSCVNGVQENGMLQSFEKMKLEAMREVEMARKSRDITGAAVRGFAQNAKEVEEASMCLKECEAEYEKMNARLAALKKEVRLVNADLAAKRADAAQK